MNKLGSYQEIVAGEERRASLDRRQTSMLQGLRRRGHQVSFAPEVALFQGTPEPPWRLIRPAAPEVQLPLSSSPYLSRYDRKPCPYCGHEMLVGDSRRAPTRDHKIPRSRTKQIKPKGVNILIVCRACNGDKGDMTLDEFAAFLTKRGDLRAAVVWNLIERGG